jgi:hypothetical protein
MENAGTTNGNSLPNEVKIDLNVFGALMLNQVGGHGDHTDVVVDQGSTAGR